MGQKFAYMRISVNRYRMREMTKTILIEPAANQKNAADGGERSFSFFFRSQARRRRHRSMGQRRDWTS